MQIIQVNTLTAEQVLPLRHSVLRPGQPLTSAMFNEDTLSSTVHIGALINDTVIGVATFVPEAHPELKTVFFKSQNIWRLRGMATDQSYQRQGVGRVVVQRGVEVLQERGCDFLWCNARVAAFAFYERLGFQYWGELFDIPGVGIHKVMYKEI